MSFLQKSAYSFDLPEALIANQPAYPRDSARLMVIHKSTGKIEHRTFRDIIEYLSSDDQLILNTTKVLPARLKGKKATGAQIEFLLHKAVKENCWEALVKPARKLDLGTQVIFSDTFSATIKEDLGEGLKIVEFHSTIPFYEALQLYGEMPLPPYIKRPIAQKTDRDNYQTVFAKTEGAVAAPTAGLHFTNELLNELKGKGVEQLEIVLHVGLGTFKPLQVEDITAHKMHQESCYVPLETAKRLNLKKGKVRQLLIGTTSCRTIESATNFEGKLEAGHYETSIFIYPGYSFKFATALLTNFHLPESTLFMLVSAFGGYELIQKAYQIAIKEKYRFYSYGDAMLLLND